MKKLITLLLALAMLAGLTACSSDKHTDTDISESESQTSAESTALDYTDINILDYVESATYKGLKVDVDDGDTKEDKLWESILDTAVIKSYPEDKVNYYFNQTKQYYMYLANNNKDQYPTVLKHFDTDEAEMLEDAREMVAKDLVYNYIVATEQIDISEAEKSELYGKYVDKYVNDYGYNRDYVTANMTDLIHDSMLYDKTMEFLLSSNTFNVKASTTDTDER